MMERLCGTCRGAFTGTAARICSPLASSNGKQPTLCEKRYKHHPDLASLEIAADGGCDLCAAILRSLREDDREDLSSQRQRTLSWVPLLSRPYGITCRIFCYVFRASQNPPDYYHVEFLFRDAIISDFTCYELGEVAKENYEESVHALELAKERLGDNTGSPQSLSIASSWIAECTSKHKRCTGEKATKHPLPTRLLYIGEPGAQCVTLCATKILPPDTAYVTLSHCWGQVKFVTLTRKNVKAFEAGFEISKLPKSFRDAIHVTRTMSIQYIWIDCLCIMQDSEDDWKRESTLMMDVYGGGVFNIAATGATDAETGLFFNRRGSIPRSMIFEIPAIPTTSQSSVTDYFESLKFLFGMEWSKWKAVRDRLIARQFVEPGKYICEEDLTWERDIYRSPLLMRAWVLQERLLAKRTLHFTSRQLYFECPETMVAEIFTLDSHSVLEQHRPGDTFFRNGGDNALVQGLLGDHNLDRDEALVEWLRIIRIYSRLKLTYDTDRQVAIAGLARLLKPYFKCKYTAGLWDYRLEAQLLWRRPPWITRPGISSSGAPSWSWASSSSHYGVEYPWCYRELSYLPQMLNPFKSVAIEAETPNADEMSPVINGRLRIVGKLIPATLKEKPTVRSSRWKLESVSHGVKIRQEIFQFTSDSYGRDLMGKYYCTTLLYTIGRDKMFSDIAGLVLEPTGKEGEFRRVGCYFGNYFVRVRKESVEGFEACLRGRGDRTEKVQMTSDLYEEYDEEEDMYTFSVV